MSKPEINAVKFLCAVLLLTFGRKHGASRDVPYSIDEAVDAVNTLANKFDPNNETEDFL